MAEHNQCFENFSVWCDKASSWLTRHPEYSPAHQRDFRAICFDSKGRICRMGDDFMKAEFPVYWVWPDQNLFEAVNKARAKPDPWRVQQEANGTWSVYEGEGFRKGGFYDEIAAKRAMTVLKRLT